MAQEILKHSIKVPRLYKCAAKILVDVQAGGNLKTLISELKHPVSDLLSISAKFA
jgi:hypothetical protein